MFICCVRICLNEAYACTHIFCFIIVVTLSITYELAKKKKQNNGSQKCGVEN